MESYSTMRRSQLSLKTLLWMTLVVAAFLGGMALQRRIDKPYVRMTWLGEDRPETLILDDGTIWRRENGESGE